MSPYVASVLATGSEDASVRLWDLRTSRAVRRIGGKATFGATVTSVAWQPPTPTPAPATADTGTGGDVGGGGKEADVTVAAADASGGEGHCESLLFASAGSSVFAFDLRSDAVILTAADHRYDCFRDEVNQVVPLWAPAEGTSGGAAAVEADAKRGPRPLVAACDDSGDVTVLDVTKQAQYRRLKGRHDGMCTSVAVPPPAVAAAFDPDPVLVSGGMDQCIVYWDVRLARSRQRLVVMPGAADDGTGTGTGVGSAGGAQLLNPPLVHSVAFSGDGALLAAGLGDATVAFYTAQHQAGGSGGRRPLTLLARVGGYHSAAVSQVLFPPFAGARAGEDLVSNDRVFTAANDGTVLLWNVAEVLAVAAAAGAGAAPEEEDAAGSGSAGGHRGRRRRRKRRGKRGGGGSESGGGGGDGDGGGGDSVAEGGGDGDGGGDAPKGTASAEAPASDAGTGPRASGAGAGAGAILLKIGHGRNPNWLAATAHGGGTLAVADTSNEVSLYAGVSR